ncbi:hypothetical protein ONZ43_g1480 [Nemania bipapillata]|uniref:Uncharacterized protein n=1 Tax=Nemania bipapillata TaxID=110536 RepID=A0ACC2J4D9_9PEZI|nr:hypothetical protein ONZ43_g1480 [Nemania bipapillata]
MKCLAIPALLAATARAFFTSPPDGHPNYTIGDELVLEWELDNPPAATFVLTLRAENLTAYAYIPGPFGSQIGLYDLRDVVLEEALPLANGSYTWKVEPSGGDATFIGPEVYYYLRGDWKVTGTPYSSGASTDYFHLVN